MGRKQISSRSRARARFFKIMLGDFKRRIRIPPAFTKHVKGELRKEAKLRGPTGKAWSVEVKRVDNSLFFQRGWKEFVDYHCVQNGEFLVFRYDGNMIFDVKVFGISACEKDKSAFIRNPNTGQTKAREKEVEKHTKEMAIVGRIGASKKQLVLQDNNRSRALEAANAFKPRHPCFMTAMKPFNLDPKRSRLTIPRGFVRENGIAGMSSMKIREQSGRLQPLTISYRKSDGRFEFVDGWRDFWLANDLKEGDVCIFELLSGRRNELDVHIFRVAEAA